MTIAIAQIAPVWLDRDRTLAKALDHARRAAAAGAELCVFGEALVPGYPFWLEHTGAARFEDEWHKELFAHYLDQGVDPQHHLADLRTLAREHALTIVLGCMERAADRGRHSLYCALIVIRSDGELAPVHRKLVPTHEERLVWAPGDGHGLRCHDVGPFRLGGLLCWENWMTLPRAALHADGESLHVALWPGNERNTRPTAPFLAREARGYSVAAAGLMRRDDVPDHVPYAAELRAALPAVPADGGSCIAGPDGAFVVEPATGEERLIVAELDAAFVRRERLNFDPAGHYARPDVLRLELDRQRQGVLHEARLATDTGSGKEPAGVDEVGEGRPGRP
ncbi:MAG: carbon-nitrogen hydrolase family protein [bacterium]|nr:carbon-nitrogen hydrolase family protein [bacterium]